MAVPTYVASSSLSFSARTSMEIEVPAGAATGNIILVYPYLQKAGKKLSCEGGTEVAEQKQNAANSFRTAAFWVRYSGQSKIKVTWEGSESSSCLCVADLYKECDETTPIDVSIAMATFNATTASVTSIATVTNNAREVIMSVNSGGNETKQATGFTRRTNNSPATQDRLKATAGETGATTIEFSASSNGVWCHFALRPKSEGTTFTETGEGALSISGSGSEELEVTETGSGSISITGSGAEVLEFIESVSGTITVSGSFSETFEEATVTLILPQFPLSRKHPVYQPSHTGTLFALSAPKLSKEPMHPKEITILTGAIAATGGILAIVGAIPPDAAIGAAGAAGISTLGVWFRGKKQ